MKAVAVSFTVALLAAAHSGRASAETACPATTEDDPLFGTSIEGWYGTESLAVQLPSPAVLPITQPGNGIGGRLFWRSSGFRPGTESNFRVDVRSLNGSPDTARVTRATNAYIPARQLGRAPTAAESAALATETGRAPDAWRMLTGVDFRDPGCWEITASYLGQTLTFVVEAVDSDRPAADILSPFGGFNREAVVQPDSL
jgi:hypothetical protein